MFFKFYHIFSDFSIVYIKNNTANNVKKFFDINNTKAGVPLSFLFFALFFVYCPSNFDGDIYRVTVANNSKVGKHDL